MPRRKISPTDYLTSADWKGLKSAGIVKSVPRDGKMVSALDYPKMAMVMAEAIVDAATVNSDTEFAASGLTVDDIIFGYFHLPNITRDRPSKKSGELDWDWVNPVDALRTVTKSRLRLAHNAPVQALTLKRDLILFSATKQVELTNPEGFKIPEEVTAFAVTANVAMIRAYVADPAVRAALKTEKKATSHWAALVDAVPDAAAELIGALDSQIQAVVARREAVYSYATSILGPVDRAALDAQLGTLSEERATIDMRAALPSRSAEESTDAA